MAFIALQGRPGTGKTTMAASFRFLGYDVHFVDMDRKLKEQRNIWNNPSEEDGAITYIECEEPLSTRKLSEIAKKNIKEGYPTMQPKGYIWLGDYIDNIRKTFTPEQAANTILVVDSMSAVNRHLKNLLRYYAKSPKLGFDGWDVVLQNYQALFDELRALTPSFFPHVVVTIHVRDEAIKSGEETRIESRPFLDGQFREELASYFEEFYFLEVEAFGKASKPIYYAYTKPVTGIKHARSAIIDEVRVKADFREIYGKEKGEGK